MKGFRHPNLLPLHCSFIHGSDLWLVMPFIAGGSLANIISSRSHFSCKQIPVVHSNEGAYSVTAKWSLVLTQGDTSSARIECEAYLQVPNVYAGSLKVWRRI